MYLFIALSTGDMLVDSATYAAEAVSFPQRQAKLQTAAAESLAANPDLSGRFAKLMKRINRLSIRRNEVVHGQLEDAQIQRDKFHRSGGYIAGSLYAHGIARHMQESYRYSVFDIIGFANDFELCRKEVNDLCDAICDYRGLMRL